VTTATATTVTAACGAGTHAIAGGAKSTKTTGNSNNAPNVQGSFPSTAAGVATANGGSNPAAWTATFFAADASNTAFAMCVAN